MSLIRGEMIDYGVDWLTVTARTKSSRAKLNRLSQSILRSEMESGNECRPWGFAGYEGVKCGSMQYGERFDSGCARLSSGVAFDHWLDAYHAGDHVSRVDLQATLKMDQDPQRTIARVYGQGVRFNRKKNRHATVSILRSTNGTATVYFGRRQSDRFGRCYDKGRESKLDVFRDCVRFELEAKGNLSHPLTAAIARAHRPILAAAEEVRGYFRSRGIHLERPRATHYPSRIPRRRSDVERRLEWIRKQVRPSVLFLLDHCDSELVYNALGVSSEGHRVGIPHRKLKLASGK